jgi:uncharacterized membrane protein
MTAALLALMSAGLGGSGDFVGGRASRRWPVLVVIWLSQGLGVLLVLLLALATRATAQDLGYLPWGLAAGQALLLGLVAFYRALAEGKMGIVAPIAALGVVIPVVWALTVLGERLGPYQLVGIVLAIVGIVLSSGPELDARTGLRPVLLAVGAACAFGFTMLCLSQGSASEPMLTTLAMRFSLVASLTFFLVGARRVPTLWRTRTGGRSVLGVALLNVCATLCSAYAFQMGHVSLVVVLCSLYPVATVVLARVLLQERVTLPQQLGIASAMAGVVLIAAA